MPAHEANLPAFRLPLHVNLSGLSDEDAVRHVLGLYDGESMLVDAPAVLQTPTVDFSRVGGILAGLVEVSAVSAGYADRAVAFVMDADIVVRRGALEQVVYEVVKNVTFVFPATWWLCQGISLRAPMVKPNGFDATGSKGLFAAYVSDVMRIRWVFEMMKSQAQWGNEDYHIFSAVENAKFRPVEFNCPELLHAFHTHAKAWHVSRDGSSRVLHPGLGGLDRFICEEMGCPCADRETTASVVALIERVTGTTAYVRE